MVTDDANQPRGARFPRWAIVLIAAAGALVAAAIALVIAVTVGVLSGPTLGATDAGLLAPESCLSQSSAELTYTVVDCETAHAQQVVAEIDLSRNTAQYTTLAALTSYAGEICDRFFEYGLFVSSSADDRYRLVAIAVPTPEALAAGESRALCSIVAVDESPLVGSLYRAMP